MNQSEKNGNYDLLAAKWIDRSISLQEREKFNNWYHQDQGQPLFIPVDFVADAETHRARIYQKVLAGLEEEIPVQRKLWKWIAIAVSICVLFSVALYFYMQPGKRYDLDLLAKQYAHGSDVAVLTDQNGKQYLLENSVFNMSAERGRFNGRNGFVKITTPRGARYQVLLEDGTKIWLDPASSVVFPIIFDDTERNIRLFGEAYFEVAHNAENPFHVKIANNKRQLDITVIGTKFNVSAYSEDPEIKTRVFEGAVKVSSGSQNAVLKKGEQVSFKDGILQPKLKGPDDDWMQPGTLYFDNEDVQQVMRKLAREYDVKLTYYRRARDRMRLTGIIRRKTSLKEVLHIIEVATDYEFSLVGDRVIVVENNKYQY